MTDDRSVDGYDRVLAESFGITPEAVRGRLRAEAKEWVSIVGAVRECGKDVPYCSVTAAAAAGDVADEFIALAVPLMHRLAGERQQEFSSTMQEDLPLDDKAVQDQLDAIRKLLRSIPQVRSFTDLWDQHRQPLQPGTNGPAELEAAFHASRERLQKLHAQLATHPRRFRDNAEYHVLMDFACTGIGGWVK